MNKQGYDHLTKLVTQRRCFGQGVDVETIGNHPAIRAIKHGFDLCSVSLDDVQLTIPVVDEAPRIISLKFDLVATIQGVLVDNIPIDARQIVQDLYGSKCRIDDWTQVTHRVVWSRSGGVDKGTAERWMAAFARWLQGGSMPLERARLFAFALGGSYYLPLSGDYKVRPDHSNEVDTHITIDKPGDQLLCPDR